MIPVAEAPWGAPLIGRLLTPGCELDRMFSEPAASPDDRALMTPPATGRHGMNKVNLSEKFSLIHEQWSPKIVGEVNDCQVKLVKVQGEFVWHSHPDEDELFLVVQGRLRMQFRDRVVVLEPGEFIVVPRGIEHCPAAEGEVQLLLVEPRSTMNTGTAGGERTREPTWI